MNQVTGSHSNGGGSLPIENLPPGALQALYHHVTGKTENMNQTFDGNVLIYSKDVDILHRMLCDQIATHHVEFGPTVTMDVKHANERSFHHSTWEHYKAVVPVTSEITSEVTIKFEFVLNLQNTVGLQRCSISILLDSALPLINQKDGIINQPWAFWMFVSKEWATARVSIDFVDFMVARGFVNVIEEWFKSLQVSPTPRINKKLLDSYKVFSAISGQMAQVGFAIFIAIYLYSVGAKASIVSICYAACVGLIIRSLYLIVRPTLLDYMIKRIAANIVPSVILISDADLKCYDGVAKSLNSTKVTILTMVATVMLSVVVNLASSFIYTLWTGK